MKKFIVIFIAILAIIFFFGVRLEPKVGAPISEFQTLLDKVNTKQELTWDEYGRFIQLYNEELKTKGSAQIKDVKTKDKDENMKKLNEAIVQ